MRLSTVEPARLSAVVAEIFSSVEEALRSGLSSAQRDTLHLAIDPLNVKQRFG